MRLGLGQRRLLFLGCLYLGGACLVPTAPASGFGNHSHEVGATHPERGRPLDSGSVSQNLRRRTLEVGLENQDSLARDLLASGEISTGRRARTLAIRLAPGLPLTWGTLANDDWQRGNYSQAMAGWFEALSRVPGHLEAGLWWAASLWLLFSTVVIGSSLLFIVGVACRFFLRAAHDAGDILSDGTPLFARVALLSSLLLLPMSLGEGGLGLVLSCLALGIVYGTPRDRVILGIAGALLVLALDVGLRMGGRYLFALESDPVALASLSVIRGAETPALLEELASAGNQGDPLAQRMLATRARRRGNVEEAEARFLRLLDEDPDDPMALSILGNIAFVKGRTEDALAFYQRGQGPRASAQLMYGLSQAYSRVFRMEDAGRALIRAQEIDPIRMVEYQDMADANFVADPPFPMELIRDRMLAGSDGEAFRSSLMIALAPGWLGERGFHAGSAVALIFLLGLALPTRYRRSGKCSSCRRRICVRCDSLFWSDDLCFACHRLLSRPEETDSELRRAKIIGLRRAELRVEKWGVALALLIPGVAGLRAERPVSAYLSLLLFSLALLSFHWRAGVVPDPLSVGPTGVVTLSLVSVLSLGLYLAVSATALLGRRGA